MKFMLVGDSHGNTAFMTNAIWAAADMGDIDAVIQLGDFGFWPGLSGEIFLQQVEGASVRSGMPLWVVDGNHDWPEMYRALSTSAPTFTVGVQHIARGTVALIDGRSFGFLGGAISIDQNYRTEGRSWWADEELSDTEVRYALRRGPVDVMLSHDAPRPPMFPPLSFGEAVDAKVSRQAHKLLSVIERWRPLLHVHGHWHGRYTCPTPWGTRVGLAHEAPSSGIAILDTADLTVS